MPQPLTHELLRFPNSDKLAQAAAQAWLLEISSQLPVAPKSHAGGSTPQLSTYTVALSGGRIARDFFIALGCLLKTPPKGFETAGRGLLEAVHFFWGDERCVPPADSESNYAVARELLFTPLTIPEDQIHRIHGEEPPDVAAAQAEAEICRIAPLDGDGQPVLDLIFLGMGEDGHVASLFPGEPEAAITSKSVYRAVVAAKPPPHRITLGYPAIAAARQVWVLASGPGKENALRQSLSQARLSPEISRSQLGPVRLGPPQPSTNLGDTPLARVLRLRGHTLIFTDIPL